MSSKKYYKDIDLIRLLACIAVLLYHLNGLKGGYLAVCVFFVLSGYLSCISAIKKEKFSFFHYYCNRFLKIYIPLIIVVFCTISIIPLFPNINWFNLKPETTSVLLGYNNFWQLGANLDYFARHVNSPFIHLWYISILLQFDLIFPFIFWIFKKAGDKINRCIPCILSLVLSIISAIYFYKMSLNQNIMVSYYDTFSRGFSLFFGVTLAFIHSYYGSLIPKIFNKKSINRLIFSFYTVGLILLFIFIDAKSLYFPISMVVSTLITCRLIDYGITEEKKRLNVFDKLVKLLSGISYEIYLVQYPIIFFLQYVDIAEYLYVPIVVILILLSSFLLHFCYGNIKRLKVLKNTLCIIVYLVFLNGLVHYNISKDYTADMKLLEEQLAKNQEIVQKKQEEYKQQLSQENENWELTLKDLENGENELYDMISTLKVVGIGDSVMLGAAQNLYEKFPNGYFNAEISRTAWVASGILENLKNNGILGNPIVLNLGANGDCSDSCKIEIIKKCGDRKIFWINVTNDKSVNVNDDLLYLSSIYDNLHIIDWNSISKDHPEYFIADGIHLTNIGKQAYTKVIYDSIYEVYLDEYIQNKEEIIKEHNQNMDKRICFFGNNILLNLFDDIHSDFASAQFIINQEFNFEMLKKEIEKSKEDGVLTKRIVFAFDKSTNLSLQDYEALIDLCSDKEVYILALDEQINSINNDNVHVIDFYHEIKNNDNYLMVDKVHLTKDGNNALSKVFKDILL